MSSAKSLKELIDTHNFVLEGYKADGGGCKMTLEPTKQMKTTTLHPPHGWVGGKSRLAKQIVSLIPNDHDIYIEVFGGALNVLYAKEKLPKASYREVVNDLNSNLINLHRVIRNDSVKMEKFISKMLISRECFNDIRKGKIKPKNNIEKASYFYYLLSLSFGSKGDNFAMPKSRKPKNIYKSFSKWEKRLKFVTIENMDFQKLIESYDREDAFFYCDPPYFGTESYYKGVDNFSIEHHKRLFKTLSSLKGRFLLSYNDCDFVRELYKDFKMFNSKEIEYTLGKNAHGKNKTVSELYICNY